MDKRYDIEALVKLREADRPKQDTKPIEEDYWVKLMRKADQQPANLTKEEIFELGRLCGKLFNMASGGEDTMNVISFTRHFNDVLRYI